MSLQQLTIKQIAKDFRGVKIHRVRYAINNLEIVPSTIIGSTFLYDHKSVRRIKKEIFRIALKRDH